MRHEAELGEFLRTRRSRLRPADVGLEPSDGPRRVSGLRRSELARLAGVSVDYYTRLEQGRDLNPSPAVIDAISRALCLDRAERIHLTNLAGPRPSTPRRKQPRQRVRPAARQLVATFDRAGTPAFVKGRRTEILATNALGSALLTDFGALPVRERRLARWVFLSEAARSLYVDWAQVATEQVATLRMEAGRWPDDPELAELVGELSMRSERFRRAWASHNVRECSFGQKRFRHPVVGELTVNYEALILPGDAGQSLLVYTPPPGSPSETAMRLLADWTHETAPAARATPVTAG